MTSMPPSLLRDDPVDLPLTSVEHAEPTSQNEYAIIGASAAGKTTILGTLHHALMAAPMRGEPSFNLGMFEANDRMRALQALGLRTVLEGVPATSATNDAVEYRFALRALQRSLLRRTVRRLLRRTDDGREGAEFRWLDGPGGAIAPRIGDEHILDTPTVKALRQAMVAQLAHARGVLLCIDSTDPDSVIRLFTSVNTLLQEATALRRLEGGGAVGPLSWERVAICLTKADAYFTRRAHEQAIAGERLTPLDLLDLEPAVEGLKQVMAYPTAKALVQYCPEAHFGITWTSVFGFLADGRANYDPATKGLLMRYDPANPGQDSINSWVPYRLVDPFAWLANQPGANMAEYSATALLRAMRPA